jgi:hypothetical protein
LADSVEKFPSRFLPKKSVRDVEIWLAAEGWAALFFT